MLAPGLDSMITGWPEGRELVVDDARVCIGATTGGEGDDDAHHFIGEALRVGFRQCRQRSEAEHQRDEFDDLGWERSLK